MTVLKANNIHKSFGNIQVLKGVNLILESGESMAILGRSGEGKTTLLHILGNLEEPDSGHVEIGSKLLTKNNAPFIRREKIGFIFQSYNLLEDFTALENVLMPARIARKQVSEAKGLNLLLSVGLEEKKLILAKNLSGGERQRIAIARALCNDPSIILADEPTGNLDRANSEQVSNLLLGLKRSLVLVTHDSELASLCQHQYILKNGKLEKLGLGISIG